MTEALEETIIDPAVNDTFFAGDSEMAALMRRKDWSQTPLGPITTWPQSLKTTIRILLTSRFAMWMGWGPELSFFYNDSYRPTLGIKHPQTLGIPADEVWAEIWKDIGPRIQHVLSTGEATWDEALLLLLERSGYAEETYHTFSYSPLADDSGNISGMLCVVTEETERVIGERRLALLRDVASTLASVQTIEEIFAALPQSFEANARDLPFSLIYLFESEGCAAHLACSSGIPPGHAIALPHLREDAIDTPWPLPALLTAQSPVLIDNLDTLFPSPPSGPWDRAPKQAVLLPLMQQGQERPAGFLVAAINPYRRFDAAYQGFMGLLAGQLASSLANARAYEEEKRRTEELAKLDRAKTAFFSNVSHEFRTPLTLMLGPLDDLLTESEEKLRTEQRESLTAVLRNGQRLLKLVNTLLDFTRIEAGRVQARFEPTDLANLTAELTSVFRSAVEKAGMRLLLNAPPLSEPVYVDRDMWEKIVLNLLSNAFKFTLEGEIEVRLEERDHQVLLSVRDTGTGIPADHLSHIFERFHRVEGRRARTHEGTGIGLALVQELVRLHGGTVDVESTPGIGTTFCVAIPLGRAHLPQEQVAALTPLSSTALSAEIFVEEALRWLPETLEDLPSDPSVQEETLLTQTTNESKDGRRPCVLLADDNADMRAYVGRLLRPNYEVIAVSDGLQALRTAEQRRPDLVLSDVMMPALDGFGLLQALRSNPYTASVPVILLSARAGEEARIEGLNSGADDYLTKPFSARELLARVASQIELSRVRREAEQAIRQSEIQLAAMNVRLQRAMIETHHRVKNNLQLISALIEMQQNGSEEMIPASELARLSSNVRALSVIHDILTTEAKFGNDQESVSAQAVLEKLATVLQKTAGQRPLRYAFSDIRLPGRQATSLALVVNELVLNALKYGQGETAVLFNVGTDTATLEILDDGPGFPSGFVPKQAANTGLELVENIVEWDLNGRTTFARRPEGGARITVTFPITPPDPPSSGEV